MLVPLLTCLVTSVAVSVDAAALSTVTLDCKLHTMSKQLAALTFYADGSFTGLTNTANGIIYFRGVRYAEPPVGDLRWRAPVSPPTSQLGSVNATSVGSHGRNYRAY
jgi:hypothetical protein